MSAESSKEMQIPRSSRVFIEKMWRFLFESIQPLYGLEFVLEKKLRFEGVLGDRGEGRGCGMGKRYVGKDMWGKDMWGKDKRPGTGVSGLFIVLVAFGAGIVGISRGAQVEL